MSEFKIESGIEIPKTGSGRKSKYPFCEMAVGESFFVPGKRINNVSSSAIGYGKRYGKKFSCRTAEGGVRVWRVE